jgi:hypothetical protein
MYHPTFTGTPTHYSPSLPRFLSPPRRRSQMPRQSGFSKVTEMWALSFTPGPRISTAPRMHTA